MVDLGNLPDGVESYAAAVNDSGQVVGWSGNADDDLDAVSWAPAGES